MNRAVAKNDSSRISLAASIVLLIVGAMAPASVEAIGEGIEFECLIEPKKSIVLSAPVIGVVGDVFVSRGDFVSKGQVLAALESSVEKTAVAVARARAEAKAEIEGSQARLDFERRRYVRAANLHSENILADEGLDEMQSNVVIAESNALQARENARLAKLDHERAQAALNVRTITSPVDGVIVKIILNEGEYADPPQILELAQIDPLHVEVYAPASFVGRIKVGDVGRVHIDTPVVRTFEAVVTVVDRVVDAASGTLGIRLEMPNQEREVLAGINCRVQF